jgi:hypothetical protein
MTGKCSSRQSARRRAARLSDSGQISACQPVARKERQKLS